MSRLAPRLCLQLAISLLAEALHTGEATRTQSPWGVKVQGFTVPILSPSGWKFPVRDATQTGSSALLSAAGTSVMTVATTFAQSEPGLLRPGSASTPPPPLSVHEVLVRTLGSRSREAADVHGLSPWFI